MPPRACIPFFLMAFLSANLSACGFVNYSDSKPGTLSGSIFVMWLEPGFDSNSGDGKFLFVPAPNDPLVFVPAEPYGAVTRITPQMMYTDGGSIPRIAQAFRGFNPWGYAPAYMLHDWIFVVKNCAGLTDYPPGWDPQEIRAISAMEFRQSATLMGDVIRTMEDSAQVGSSEIAPAAITSAVSGSISRAKWKEDPASCQARLIPDDLRDDVNAALGFTLADTAAESIARDTGLRIVTQISF
ncbi:hypothetical protein ROA7450_00789 [Roseovarius albus]|uniref:DUF1353 domain-containing protein n=1 Tax=Roseovarius albus TaxID=1247867 RepID=A0A1X6YJR6_9RHOB|nr:hypothetical protein [Roseovarius albus]SLN21733.1 hypothetical protein ROA7450_00789 [Roseovarius albus]